MAKIIFFRGDAFRDSAVLDISPVFSTVSDIYPFFFLLRTHEGVYRYSFKTHQEAQDERERLRRLLGKPA